MNTTKGNVSVLALALIALIAGCSKKHNSTPPPATSNNTNPYYFRFTVSGHTDTLHADHSISWSSYLNSVLGTVSGGKDLTLTPCVTLRFSLPTPSDTVKESDILGLAGKTLLFSDTIMTPQLEYDSSDASEPLSSLSYADSSFYVKISNVVFLATDTFMGNPVRKYVITGTCRALVFRYPVGDEPLTGAFNMVISRVTY